MESVNKCLNYVLITHRILKIQLNLASWLGEILLIIRPELKNLDLSFLPTLIGVHRGRGEFAGKIPLEQKTDEEIGSAYATGGEEFLSLFRYTH